ncbi:MAG: MYXO-CTERM sorting domain-containing protein [Myxococcales bacterium]
MDRLPGLSLAVSQTPSDSSRALTTTTPGFTVDTLAPRAPTIAAPANGAATRQTSPALQITAAEAGGKLAVSVLDGAGTVVANCLPQTISTSLAVTCSPTPALADGVYTLSAIQTDLAANPSAPGTSTLRVKTRTATPLLSSQLVGKTLANPVHVEGTAEPGASVVVKIDDAAPLPAVTADVSGHFSASAGVIATGAHFVVATATDSLGNTAPSAREQFDVSLAGHLAGSGFGCSSAGGSGTFGALLLLGLVPLLGRRRGRKGIALAAAVAAGAGAARADGTDIGLDNFRPASGGDGTIGVEGARPLEDGEAAWEARGLLVGQSKPLMFVPDGGGEAQSLIRSRVGGWLTGQGHLWGPLSLGVQLPFLVQQSGDLSPIPTNVSGGAVLGGGLGDLRTTMRAAILRQERSGFDLAMQGSLDLPTANKESFLGDSSLQGEALAAAGHRWAFSERSALDLLGNVYFRFRPERDVLGVKTGDELGLRAGLAWLPGGGPFAPRRVIFEIEGAAFLRAGLGDGSVPGEWRGGVSYCAGPMTFDLALGGALSSGIGTPGVRIIGGVGFSPSVCGSNARGAPLRPPTPVHLTEAAPPAAEAKPEMAAAPSSVPSEPKPAPVAAAAAAPKTGAKNEVTMLPLPELPPLPPPKAAKKQKRTVASAEPMPSMPALPAVSAIPLPAAAPRASLSGDHVELARPIAFSGSHVPAKEPTLDSAAKLLAAHPEIELVGISAPDDAHAKSVIAYLSKHGVASKRLRAEGRSDAVEIKVLRRR